SRSCWCWPWWPSSRLGVRVGSDVEGGAIHVHALKDHFRLLAKYNRTANARLLDACSGLPLGALEAQSSAPFGSIAGLLDHLLAADEVWLARFEGDLGAQLKKAPRQPLDLAAFRTRREALDARIEAFAAGLTDDDLAR